MSHDDANAGKLLTQVALVTPSPCMELVNQKRAHTVDPAYLVELAKEVGMANTTIKAGACGKLEIIAQQIRFLQEQARTVLLDAAKDDKISNAQCNFVKKPGNVYHVYKKEGQSYLSMLSPGDWGGSPPHEFLGSYKLEFDMTFTPLADIKRREEEMKTVEHIFDQRHNVTAISPAMPKFSIDWVNGYKRGTDSGLEELGEGSTD